jgi:hypothetical protein
MPAQALPKPYQYPKRRKAGVTARVSRPQFGELPGENLSGIVQGKDASDLEERFCRAMDADDNWSGYEFRRIIIAPARTVGSIEIDVWAHRRSGEEQAIDIDGEWVHAQPKAVKKDKEDRDRIDEYLMARGLPRLIVVSGRNLQTPEDAKQTVSEL